MRFNLFFGIQYLILICACSFYASAQTFEWAIQTGGGTYVDRTNSGGEYVCTDTAGNVYVTGFFYGTCDFDPGTGTALLSPLNGRHKSIFLAKYNSKGEYLWARTILSMDSITSPASPRDVVVDLNGRVTVIGEHDSRSVYFNTPSGIDSFPGIGDKDRGLFMIQYDHNGNYLWAKFINNPNFNAYYSNEGNKVSSEGGLAVDRIGNLYITGWFQGKIDFDPSPNVADTAMVTSDSLFSQNHLYIAKYNSRGDYIWAYGIGAVYGARGVISGLDIVIDTTEGRNDVCITGNFQGNIDFDPGIGVDSLVGGGTTRNDRNDAFIAKYDSSGDYKWARKIGGSGMDLPCNIAIGSTGNLYVVGLFNSKDADFDPGPDTAILSAAGISDFFMAKYDPDGNYIWAKNIGAPGVAMSNLGSVALDKLENIYVIEEFYGAGNAALNFNPGSNNANAILNCFVYGTTFIAKYDRCGNFIWAGRIGSDNSHTPCRGITIYPREVEACDFYLVGGIGSTVDINPASDTFMLTPESIRDNYLLKMTFQNTPSYLPVSFCGKSYTLDGKVYTNSGKYIHRVPDITDIALCDSIVILDLTLLASLEKPIISVDKFVLGVVPGTYATYYQWIKDGIPIAGATDSTYIVTENAEYQVAISNDAGCTDTSEVYIVTNYTGIDATRTNAPEINVYPNPTGNIVYIQAPVPVCITLTDMRGRTILKKDETNSVSLKDLEGGIYLMRIMDENGILLKVEKLVKAD